MAPPENPPRLPIWEWLRTALLATNLVWTTLCLGGYLPGTRVEMIALTGLLVAAHLADPVRGTRAHPAGWLFLPFLAYAAVNVARISPFPWLGWTDWLNWFQGIAVFWVVLNGITDAACRRALGLVLVLLGVVAAALAAYQHFVRPTWLMLGRLQAVQFYGRSTGPFGIPNSLGVFLALLIPPVGWLAFSRGRAVGVRILSLLALLALASGFALAISRGAWLALAAAFALRPLFTPGAPLVRRLRLAGLAFAAVVAGAIALYFCYPAMRERAHELVTDVGEKTRPIMWRGAWRLFRSHPALGVGGGGFDPLFERYRPMGYRDQPVYAHCDYLNTLCDYGLVGFSLFFGAAGAVAWRARRATGLAAAAGTGLLAFALHLLVDFHLKVPALFMAVATVAALVTAAAWPAPAPAPRRLPARALAGAAALGTLALVFIWAVPRYKADEMRRAAREQIDLMAAAGTDVSRQPERLGAIRDQLHRAAALDPRNAQAWSDAAYADSLWALVHPADTVALGGDVTAEATRATAICPLIAEFWIREGTGLDMQRRWVAGGDSFVTALKLAPMRADVWYYEAYHDSLSSVETGPAIAAANTSLRLDPGFLLAQVLRQRLETR